MKQLLRTVAVLITLLSPAFVNTVPIEPNGNEDNLDACGNYSLTLQLPNSRVIEKYFISSPIIRCLTLEHGGIQRVENGAFDQMPNLSYLNLQGNSISASNLFSFGNLSSVRELILSSQTGGYYSQQVEVNGVYPQLQYLDLKKIGMSGIHYGVWEHCFPELTRLDLSINKLTRFAAIRPWAEKLMHLYMNDNQLSQVSLRGYSGLKSLALENNQISSISMNGLDLDGLTNLENLSVANNRISVISAGAFDDTGSLRYLNISKNLLSSIRSDIFRSLYSLEVLALDQNTFETVPIAVPLNITTLSMNCNRIKYITTNSLYNLPHLRTLSLAGNMIANVHVDAFQNQEMLEELYLYNNELSYLPDGWGRTITNLRYLDLSGNAFTLLESAVHSTIPSLQQLYFERNPLKYINANTFATISKYVTVYLDSQSDRTIVKCERSSSYQTTTNRVPTALNNTITTD
ncbi:podocan-like protein 1 [Andrena cerasifolii]|uniref:podocan-like protein 1 n=1 Tax=Andrena cerasifolii TaxID=2819439 RepID=UPI004037A04E